MTQKLLDLILLLLLETALNCETITNISPLILRIPAHLIAFTNTSQKTKVLTPINLVFKLAIQQTTQLFNLSIKYLKVLKTICKHRTCLLTFQKAFQIVDHMIFPKKL